MRSAKYEAYITSFDWWLKSKEALERAGYRCERCGAGKPLEVHHLTYERLGEERPEDLLVVCPDCHEREDTARTQRTATAHWWARVDGWATKRYGEDWEMEYEPEMIEQEFEDWLDARGEC